jgi:hypothetical protein
VHEGPADPGALVLGQHGAVHGIHGIGVGRDLTADQHLPIIAAP